MTTTPRSIPGAFVACWVCENNHILHFWENWYEPHSPKYVRLHSLVCATAFHKLYVINVNDGFESRRKEAIVTNIIN